MIIFLFLYSFHIVFLMKLFIKVVPYEKNNASSCYCMQSVSAEIGIFYLIYYSCLAAFFISMIAIFYQTVDINKPKLTGDSSLLKGNPGFKGILKMLHNMIGCNHFLS